MGRCQLSQWNLLTRHWNVCVQFVSHYNLLYLATVSPLHLSLVSAQLTCGSVTRRARHTGHVTNTGPGLLVWLRPGLYCCTSELVTSGDGPGPPVSDLGSGAVSAPLSQVVGFTHSRQCPSQGLLPAQSQGRPEFAWQTWNQFEPRGVILALLGSPLATSGAKLMLGLVPGQPGNSRPQHGLALAPRF